MWKIDEALTLIRKVQPAARRCGYALNLGGGVLNNGESPNDLDLVAMPGGLDEQFEEELIDLFYNEGFSYTGLQLKWTGLRIHHLLREGKKLDIVIPILDKD